MIIRLLLLFTAISCAQSSLQWAHTESDIPLDENVHLGELNNGFRYLIYKNAEPPGRVSLRLHVDAGSLHEAEDQRGMAHFLEHMLFEGSKNYTSAELIPEMQRLGIAFGAHANAYTSFDETVYMLDLPNLEEKTLSLGFTVMRDFCDGALLKNSEVEAERGVILSEKNTRDSVDFRLMKQQFRSLMPQHLASTRFPIGIEETIKNCPQSRIKEFYETYYTPENCTFIIIGDIDVATFEKRVQETFSSFKSKSAATATLKCGTITEPDSLQASLFTDPEVEEEDISLIRCFKHTSQPDSILARSKKLSLDISNAILARRLEKIAKKEGSPINTGSAYSNTWFDEISFGAVSVTPSEGKWQEAVEILEQEFRRVLEHGFTNAEYQEATSKFLKNAKLAVEASSTRQSATLARTIINSINDRSVITTPEQEQKILTSLLSSLSAQKCHVAYKKYWSTAGYHLILTTEKDSGNDREKLLKLYQDSTQVPVTPLEEQSAITFGYSDFGNSSEIKASSHVKDLDIHHLKLTNGTMVNIKKTDFEKGKIYVKFCVDGGLQTSTQLGLATFANAIFSEGGLGKHTSDELKQFLAGTAVSMSFSIEDDVFALSGATTQEDLALQLQLLSAYLIDPAYREEAVRLYTKSLPDTYERLSQTLEGTFEYVNAFAHGDDLRFAVPSQSQASQLTTSALAPWLGASLKDAPLELTVLGDLDLEKTKSTILKTVGTLPQRRTQASPPSSLKALPSPPLKKAFTYRSELDRAASIVSWKTRGVTQDISEARRMNVLAKILTNRMREEVREKLGSSYSPYARSSMSETFPHYGYLTASSLCKSDDMEKINTLLLTLGASLSADGASQDELDRALNPIKKIIEASLRKNNYWLTTVVSQSQSEPKRLDWARTRKNDYDKITLTEINALAKKYLHRENALVYSLSPQK